jgi:hypothetical protein
VEHYVDIHQPVCAVKPPNGVAPSGRTGSIGGNQKQQVLARFVVETFKTNSLKAKSSHHPCQIDGFDQLKLPLRGISQLRSDLFFSWTATSGWPGSFFC